MITFNTLQRTADEMIGVISEECLAQVLGQFQNLLNAGVLTVKRQPPIISITQNPMTNSYELRCSNGVELGFRGEEEIARLKAENARLEARLKAISNAIKEISNG
jgi:hypothetical protein